MSVNDSPPGSNSALRNQIAELTQTKKLLREANERLEMILVSMTERLFALDGEWRYTYFNKHAEEQLKILAKDPVRLIGKVLWDEFPNAPPEEVLRRAMSERVAITNEHYYPPLGEWVENRIYPTPDGGLAIFQTYITERISAKTRVNMVRVERRLAEALPDFRISQPCDADIDAHVDAMILVNHLRWGGNLRNARRRRGFGLTAALPPRESACPPILCEFAV